MSAYAWPFVALVLGVLCFLAVWRLATVVALHAVRRFDLATEQAANALRYAEAAAEASTKFGGELAAQADFVADMAKALRELTEKVERVDNRTQAVPMGRPTTMKFGP